MARYLSRAELSCICFLRIHLAVSYTHLNPILHENYDGSDVTLPATGMVMKVSAFPFLSLIHI